VPECFAGKWQREKRYLERLNYLDLFVGEALGNSQNLVIGLSANKTIQIIFPKWRQRFFTFKETDEPD
jgi:hypothetical protein